MKLVIFDVDGTLVNSEAIILGAQRETFRQCGLAFPGREAGLGVVGLTLDIALMQLAGLSEPDDRLTETYKQVFHAMRVQAETDPAFAEPLYPGAAETLAKLAARPDITLAIATGKSRRGADYIIERNGWRELFASIQTADDAPSKPHPGMIENAMRETGAAASQTWMIGDSSFDMQMAVAAGVTPVAVAWGFQPVEALVRAGARHVAADYPALTELLLAS
ncbi:MAG: HAD-IA family hydrolase [Bosea sp. (in: a-proteobacteria)]